MFSAADHEFMTRALRLAQRGLYTTTPNPRVGCVVVHQGVVVGEGFHERAGDAHAETRALAQAGSRAQGATVYVTLEPCAHHGRTPPCADALVSAGVARVVVAMEDPNPLVAGRGLARLRAAGIQVDTGLLATEARELNIGFVARMSRGRPWVRVKSAASLDGRTALANGVSQWITGEAARRDVQHWRARACAILTGSGTVLADDPRLDVREIATPRQPRRIVVDSYLSIPVTARIFKQGETVVVTASDDTGALNALREAGVTVVEMGRPGGQVDLVRLMAWLAEQGVNELMVEAGATLNGALLEAGLIDELLLYLAPCLLGSTARGLFVLPEFTTMAQRITLDIRDVRAVGRDWRVLARVLPAKEA
ncbi:bifunctional diaminohydroxyphosphoribosylaminopyrimidine deaminase/5-amino-6-(5-phosphoribosylamino)uracil reductase RibD [Thiobacter aerophilum]|uniref:Riboflavin biosynthesis protein RibD n=1 Tax=Thiobacter aerophilum TaxID=3121275 RepID=A0ABV0EF61_9BURK